MAFKHLVDVDLQPLLDDVPHFSIDETSLPSQRQAVVTMFAPMGAPGSEPRLVRVPGWPTGAPDVALRIHRPAGEELKPAIYSIHGGGFIMGSAAMMDGLDRQLAEDSNAVVVAVDYRLAPETPFPGALEDCYAGLRWLFDNAAELGIDAERVIVVGESGGGGLAAALMLLVRDRADRLPAAQMLLYPMLDHRTGTTSAPHSNPTTGEYVWGPKSNGFAWSALQGAYQLDDDRIGHFSPARASDLSGLPPTFVAVGALDLFFEEDVDYALRASRAGVSVECHVYPGAIHGIDKFGDISLARQFRHDQQQAIARWFWR